MTRKEWESNEGNERGQKEEERGIREDKEDQGYITYQISAAGVETLPRRSSGAANSESNMLGSRYTFSSST